MSHYFRQIPLNFVVIASDLLSLVDGTLFLLYRIMIKHLIGFVCDLIAFPKFKMLIHCKIWRLI